MITIIHGDDIESSRNYFFNLKQKLENTIELNGETLLFNDFFQLSQGQNIFGKTPSLLIENFFTKNKSDDSKNIISYINENKNLELIFWESSELSKTQQTVIKNSTVNAFSIPKTMFLFLDGIKPNNSKYLTTLFQNLRKSIADELIFFMLIRQFRILINLFSNTQKVDEVRRLAPWQLSKLQKQASFFEKDKLLSTYSKLLEIDINTKTGKAPFSIESSIDFLLLGL